MSSLSLQVPLDFKLWYAGILLATVGYAAFLALSAVSIRYLWRARAGQHTLGRRVLLPYTVVLLAFGTISILLDIYVSMHQLILAAFGQATETSTLEACSVMGVVSGLAHQLPLLISDGLLLYRTFVIFQKKWIFMALPLLLYGVSFLLAFSTDTYCLANTSPDRAAVALQISGAWLALTASLNAILTVMIIVKLWPVRAKSHGNSPPVGGRASSAIGMLAESAAFYTLSGVAIVFAQFLKSDYSILFGQIFGFTAFLSSSIITFRIALGIEYVPPSSSAGPVLPTSTSGNRWSGPVEHRFIKMK